MNKQILNAEMKQWYLIISLVVLAANLTVFSLPMAAQSAHDHAHAEEDNAAEHSAAVSQTEDEHGHDEKDPHADEDANEADGHSAEGDEQDEHGEEDEEGPRAVSLSPAVLEEFDIELRVAGGGRIAQIVHLPGEVVYNADRMVDVTPPVAGIAKQVNVSVGDRVEAGDVLATF